MASSSSSTSSRAPDGHDPWGQQQFPSFLDDFINYEEDFSLFNGELFSCLCQTPHDEDFCSKTSSSSSPSQLTGDDDVTTSALFTALTERIKEYTDRLFYEKPVDPNTKEVIFEPFHERRGFFAYRDVYEDSQNKIVIPLSAIVETKTFSQVVLVPIKQPKGTTVMQEMKLQFSLENKRAKNFLPSHLEDFDFHRRESIVAQERLIRANSTRNFIASNVGDLNEGLSAQMLRYRDDEEKLRSCRQEVVDIVDRLSKIKVDSQFPANVKNEKHALLRLNRRILMTLNKEEFGLMAQLERIRERIQFSGEIGKAIELSKSSKEKTVAYPSLFKNFSITLIKAENPGVPQLLGNFYERYLDLLEGHESYFKQAIRTYKSLQSGVQVALNIVDSELLIFAAYQ